MEDKLTKEEVMHVAKLARIEIDDDELAMYQVKLKQILNEIEKNLTFPLSHYTQTKKDLIIPGHFCKVLRSFFIFFLVFESDNNSIHNQSMQ